MAVKRKIPSHDAASSTIPTAAVADQGAKMGRNSWRTFLKGDRATRKDSSATTISTTEQDKKLARWNMGMLNDSETNLVPGSVLLLSKKVSEFNEPLGLRNEPARRSASSLPSISSSTRRRLRPKEKKRTADGKFVLEPQPDDSENDPLTWPMWRRDMALLSLGFYCMLGGGMTPVLAAGFNEVAQDYGISVPTVALTTGLYMLGLGLGSVVLSPTAILYGKRPVYLTAALCFVLSSIWCALSPNFASLAVARIFMGFAVSSVECLPSATVAEIYFLHEKAYRLGIYTLLLLGGKNLVPLVSAAIIQSLGWRWVFYIVAMVVGFGLCLLFFFVPESYWDRSPTPHGQGRRGTRMASTLSFHNEKILHTEGDDIGREKSETKFKLPQSSRHAHFQTGNVFEASIEKQDIPELHGTQSTTGEGDLAGIVQPALESQLSPSQQELPDENNVELDNRAISPSALEGQTPHSSSLPDYWADTGLQHPYTATLQSAPRKTFVQQLKPFSGRINNDNWFRVAARPFVLFAYPAILWSTLVYSLSIGWLIVLSESVAAIYEDRSSYNFTPLQAGLVYISPFVGGILGTAVAGKVSDIIVRFMARGNGGIYEPEFRLVMAIPIAFSTVIGLMGYGWSAQEHDAWIVPTIFFGLISFGCSLGSTTSITFAVDSYRQYAGEALVTLNFSKNILHGLVFSLFFNRWLETEGSRDVFIAIGGIQLACLLTTIPMYIYGKRARMWMVRKNLMEKF
nr:putative mfs-type transporter [Quercus suber]